jgi:hypothetical protein
MANELIRCAVYEKKLGAVLIYPATERELVKLPWGRYNAARSPLGSISFNPVDDGFKLLIATCHRRAT